MSELLKDEKTFYGEIRELLQQSRNVAYKAVNYGSNVLANR